MIKSKPVIDPNIKPRFYDVNQARARTGLSRGLMLKFAEEAGAVRHIGRRLLIDVEIFEKALSEMEG